MRGLDGLPGLLGLGVWRVGVAAVLLGLVAVAAPAQAQVSAADSAAVLAAVAEDIADRGEAEVARWLWEEVVRRWPGTPGAEAALARLAELTGATGLAEPVVPGDSGDRSGETGFKVWSTAYGVWVGAAVPALAGARGTEPYGAGILVGGPAGYLAARAFAGSRPLSVGQARAISWGGTWGTWQGLGWATALDLGADDGKVVVGAALAGGVTGILAGALLSAGGTANGTSSSAFLGSLWGTWFGVAGSQLFGWDGDAGWRATLLAGNAGLAVGALAARGGRIGVRRAHLISLGGLIGATSGVGVVLLARPYGEAAEFGIPLAGSAAGLIVGALLTRHDPGADVGANSSPTRGQAPAPLLGALLNWSGGDFSLGVPLPVATTVRAPSPARPHHGATSRHREWTVPLARIRF